MKKQLPEKQYTISDFQFSIYPKTITFRSSSQGRYSLYLEKGISKFKQVLKLLESINKLQLHKTKFSHSRLFKEKNLGFLMISLSVINGVFTKSQMKIKVKNFCKVQSLVYKKPIQLIQDISNKLNFSLEKI